MAERVATMDQWTAGDWTGLVGGVLAGLAALGKTLAWLLNWRDERNDGRETRLAKWEASLARRERDQRDEMEAKFDALEARLETLTGENHVLAASLIEVTSELRVHAPRSPALQRAAAALRMAFPLEHDFETLLARLDKAGAGDERGR